MKKRSRVVVLALSVLLVGCAPASTTQDIQRIESDLAATQAEVRTLQDTVRGLQGQIKQANQASDAMAPRLSKVESDVSILKDSGGAKFSAIWLDYFCSQTKSDYATFNYVLVGTRVLDVPTNFPGLAWTGFCKGP